MWFRKKKTAPPEHQTKSYPVKEMTLDEVRQAVRDYGEMLPKGVRRSVLVQPDQSIDFRKLAPHLKAVPSEPFYMSRETYEIFEAKDREIPLHMDKVQQAVDRYMKQEKRLPLIEDHPEFLIDVNLLKAKSYLDDIPPMPFYLTREEYMVSRKPSRQS